MLTEHRIASPRLSAPRAAWIDLPEAGATKDCLLFLDGELYLERVQALQRIGAAQAAGTLPALNSVFLSSVSAAHRQTEYTCHERFASFLAVDLPRWIEQAVGRCERLFLCGLSLSGLQAVFTAVRFPDIFAGVLSQSPSAWWQNEWLTASLRSAEATAGRFWLSVGTEELQENVAHPPTPLLQTTSQLASVRRLARRLTDAGHSVHSHEYHGGHDPACWSAELPQSLHWLVAAR